MPYYRDWQTVAHVPNTAHEQIYHGLRTISHFKCVTRKMPNKLITIQVCIHAG